MKKPIDAYIERYCAKHGCTPMEAETHYIVREVAKQYEAMEKTNMTITPASGAGAEIGECK